MLTRQEHSQMDFSFLCCLVGHSQSVMSRSQTWSSDRGRCQSSHTAVITAFFFQPTSRKTPAEYLKFLASQLRNTECRNTEHWVPFSFFFWESLRFLFSSYCSALLFIGHVRKAWHFFLETVTVNSIHSERTSVTLTAQEVKCTGLLSDTWAVNEQ